MPKSDRKCIRTLIPFKPPNRIDFSKNQIEGKDKNMVSKITATGKPAGQQMHVHHENVHIQGRQQKLQNEQNDIVQSEDGGTGHRNLELLWLMFYDPLAGRGPETP